jgi:8-oxo-dGTP pyrophosphatase MutT (NUDIX family)
MTNQTNISEKIYQIKQTHQMIKEIEAFPTSTKNSSKNKTHYVSVTGIIRNKEGKYLICKRSPNEKIFPNLWCVPGGKIETKDFINQPKDTKNHWFNIIEKTLEKEIYEETSLKIKNISYISNLALLRPNGHLTLIISMSAEKESGEVKLNKEELTSHAWVTPKEAENYNLIENILEQIKKADKLF